MQGQRAGHANSTRYSVILVNVKW